MPQPTTKIALSETGQFSRVIIDYIHGDERLKPFYSYFPEAASFEKAMADRSGKAINRHLLTEVLTDQYHSKVRLPLDNFQRTASNIELLKNENAFTVCTGHQLCLFTGPLYFIYKIISTINLAEALKKTYPENDFVPVYWMASEDHDFEEIRSVHLFGKTLSWDNPSAKGAAGRMNTTSLDQVIDEMGTILGDSENAKELITLFKNAYLEHSNVADATRFLVHELFCAYGLVIIDADDKRLKSEFADIIADDLKNNTNFKLVNSAIAELEKINVKAQVNPREINVFRLKEDRIRIEQSTAETLALPVEEYSPNVVLRPLYQQRILPNIAYVGGPGEIAYWLEYKSMFGHHGIMFPVLVPRNFALLTDERTTQQISKLGFEFKDLFREQETLIKEYVSIHTEDELSLKEEEQKLNAAFAGIAEKAVAVDPTLKGTVEAELQKALNALKNIENKLLRAEKQKQETGINQVKKLKERFFPEGNLQERYDNFSPYYLKYGKQFIPALKEAFDPFNFELLIIELK